MVLVTPSGQYGLSAFTVSPSGGSGAYNSISTAVAAAAAAGGGTLYIAPGNYHESVTWISGISVQASSTGSVNKVVIMGNQQFTDGLGSLAFSNIAFTSSSGDAWTFSGNGSNPSIEFNNCSVTSTTGNGITITVTGANPQLMVRNSSITGGENGINAVSGSCSLLTDDATITTIGTANSSIYLGGTTQLNAKNGSNYVASSGSSNCMTLATTASGRYKGGGTYQVTSKGSNFVAANAAFSINTPASVQSVGDGYQCSGSYYITTTLAPGSVNFNYAYASVTGNATSMHPSITPSSIPQSPNETPSENGQLLIGATGVAPSLNTLQSGPGISIVNGPGTITISSSAELFWQAVSHNTSMTSNSGYIVNGGGAITLSLPSSPSVGDVVAIVMDTGGTSWQISQSGTQQIRFGQYLTTAGSSGSLSSTALGDTVNLVCSVAGSNSRWVAYSGTGNLTLI
jgi:hypothetical protein